MTNHQAKIIVIANEKGGVGKTAVSINLARALVEIGRRVLVIDLDQSAGATTALGIGLGGWYTGLDVIAGGVSAEDAIVSNEDPEVRLPKNLHIIPASTNFDKGINDFLQKQENSMMPHSWLLKTKISSLYGKYDYIIIDTSPLVTSTTAAAFGAANYVIIPTQLEKLSIERIEAVLLRTLSAHKFGAKIDVLGIVPTMVPKPLTRLATHHLTTLAKKYLAKVGSTEIPLRFDTALNRAVALPEGQEKKMTLFEYDPTHPLINAFKKLAEEVETRIEKNISFIEKYEATRLDLVQGTPEGIAEEVPQGPGAVAANVDSSRKEAANQH